MAQESIKNQVLQNNQSRINSPAEKLKRSICKQRIGVENWCLPEWNLSNFLLEQEEFTHTYLKEIGARSHLLSLRILNIEVSRKGRKKNRGSRHINTGFVCQRLEFRLFKRDKGVTLCLGAKLGEGNKDYYYARFFACIFSAPSIFPSIFDSSKQNIWLGGHRDESSRRPCEHWSKVRLFWFTGRVGFIIINAWTRRLWLDLRMWTHFPSLYFINIAKRDTVYPHLLTLCVNFFSSLFSFSWLFFLLLIF